MRSARIVGVALALACALGVGAARPRLAVAHADLDELERTAGADAERHPDDPAAHLQLATVHRLAHAWDAALAALEAAAAKGADADAVGTMRGQVFLDAGWPRMARIEFDRVVARRPDAYGARFERGRAWLALGDAEHAAADFGAAIAGMARPTPEHVMAQRDALLSLGRRSDAVAALDAGMARIGPAVSLELAAVDLEVELGRYDAALDRLDRLLGRDAVSPAWVARRGEVLERAGRAGDARAEYTRALALIDARGARRTATAFTDLRRRLETALASAALDDGASKGEAR